MKVGDQFRQSPLSFVPGGCTVVVVEKGGKQYEYDKIKYPKKYIQSVMKNPNVIDAYVKS